ncbi:hypothetical protein HPP92_007572 [Vanilla planifolia]|uniref:Uncharacterized protein n=1 Tax=Vanilla planifolia TaxID=51239 RepID=A0A835RGP0_VANPL|nr:hypothetical protein HPP92_007572 [Vanilla planifolia]
MDAYEATRIVFSRIQKLDPENAAKVMGLLLIQEHGEKEMIRLAFGPEALLQTVIIKARKELGLLPSSSPATPSGGSSAAGVFSRQNSARFHTSSPFSWSLACSPRSFSGNGTVVDELPPAEELSLPHSVEATASTAPFYSGGDIINELQLQDQLSFLSDGGAGQIRAKTGDVFLPEIAGESRSPGAIGEGMLLPNSMGWVSNGQNHRRSDSISDLCLGSDLAGVGFGWRPCLYFARGYCKNGSSCRFLHDEATAAAAASFCGVDKLDSTFEQDLLLRSNGSRLVASAAPFPYSPTTTIPPSPSASAKYMNFLLQHQNDSQRAAGTAAALMLGSAGEEVHRLIGRARMEKIDFAALSNPGARQIYLTFPADSTFREEDVSNYFSIYGPVQDVRIPYQQKRMFGFVTFVYPETVKLILAKGNPHFVCDARVLVKPYKEKGKVPDKKQQQQTDRVDFSGGSTPTSLDSPFDLAGRMILNIGGNGVAQDASLLRRRLEQQQQQAELLQQAIELQGRRFQLLDLQKKRFAPSTTVSAAVLPTQITSGTMPLSSCNGISSPAVSQQDDKDSITGFSAEMQEKQQSLHKTGDKEKSVENSIRKEEDIFQECPEHNLPDSPFASPTKSTVVINSCDGNHLSGPVHPPSPSTSCFFQVPPRFSSGHGAVGM